MKFIFPLLALVIFIPPSLALADHETSSKLLKETEELLAAHDDSAVFDGLNQRQDILYDVLAKAYANNATLKAARAELLVTREQLPQAQAGFKPTLSADVDVIFTDTQTDGQSFISSEGGNTSKSATLNLSQPLYRGGRTLADIRAAKNIITAQELALSATEQGILYDVAVAYVELVQSKAILALNENNKSLAARELERAENGFKVGELTRTDVSQAKARLAEARAQIIQAESSFDSAVAVYQQLVDETKLPFIAFPAKKLELPASLKEALALAETNNRTILQSKFIAAAAEDDVDSQFGVLLPEVSAIGQLNKTYDPTDFIDDQRQASVGLSASIPLYQAGATRSRVREAKHRANQRYLQMTEAHQQMRQEIITTWKNLRAAEAEIKARSSQIDAARVAREGVHYETEFGERTLLDVLDSNQELLNAQVNYVQAQGNEIIARFALARNLGVLVPQKLGFSGVAP